MQHHHSIEIVSSTAPTVEISYRVYVSGLYFIFSGHFETQVPLLLKSAQTAQSVGSCPVQPPAH